MRPGRVKEKEKIMKLIYDKNYSNTKLTNLTVVEEVLKLTGAIVDACILPLLQEAENGDYIAMKELWEMFVNGSNNVKPNYEMAKRYQYRLSIRAKQSKTPINIAQAMINNAYMTVEFENDFYEMLDPILDAFRYMVANCAFDDWDMEFYNYVNKIHAMRASDIAD